MVDEINITENILNETIRRPNEKDIEKKITKKSKENHLEGE